MHVNLDLRQVTHSHACLQALSFCHVARTFRGPATRGPSQTRKLFSLPQPERREWSKSGQLPQLSVCMSTRARAACKLATMWSLPCCQMALVSWLHLLTATCTSSLPGYCFLGKLAKCSELGLFACNMQCLQLEVSSHVSRGQECSIGHITITGCL